MARASCCEGKKMGASGGGLEREGAKIGQRAHVPRLCLWRFFDVVVVAEGHDGEKEGAFRSDDAIGEDEAPVRREGRLADFVSLEDLGRRQVHGVALFGELNAHPSADDVEHLASGADDDGVVEVGLHEAPREGLEEDLEGLLVQHDGEAPTKLAHVAQHGDDTARRHLVRQENGGFVQIELVTQRGDELTKASLGALDEVRQDFEADIGGRRKLHIEGQGHHFPNLETD